MKKNKEQFIVLSGSNIPILLMAFERLKKGTIFEGVLKENGFINNPEKENVFSKIKSGETIILIKKGDQINYHNPNVSWDKGSLLEFIQFRIPNGGPRDYKTDLPLLVSVILIGIDYENKLASNTNRVKRRGWQMKGNEDQSQRKKK